MVLKVPSITFLYFTSIISSPNTYAFARDTPRLFYLNFSLTREQPFIQVDWDRAGVKSIHIFVDHLEAVVREIEAVRVVGSFSPLPYQDTFEESGALAEDADVHIYDVGFGSNCELDCLIPIISEVSQMRTKQHWVVTYSIFLKMALTIPICELRYEATLSTVVPSSSAPTVPDIAIKIG